MNMGHKHLISKDELTRKISRRGSRPGLHFTLLFFFFLQFFTKSGPFSGITKIIWIPPKHADYSNFELSTSETLNSYNSKIGYYQGGCDNFGNFYY